MGLFQRQLAAAGLGDVAEKAAAGAVLELDDAVLLSRASLPLLGRIVQSHPSTNDAALPIQRVTGIADIPYQIAQPLADWETFCRELLAVRRELGATSEPAAWYPKVSRPPDEDGSSDGNFTGVEVLRAIALARLLLPANVQIVAPLATLGPKLAQVALEFGASHLGYVAADGPIPDGPLVADPRVLDELLGSCLPTALKEDL